jgi:hypothetical protein
MTVLSAAAQFDPIIVRTQAVLARAKAEGEKLGRKPTLSDAAPLFEQEHAI